MAEQFRVAPQLRNCVDGLHDGGSDLSALVSDLRAQVGEVWDALTHGDADSFRQQFNSLTETMEDQAKWLTGLGNNLGVVADSAQRSDQQASA
jgi:uncharacterized protein YukE